ncbi:MAG: tetratricopeptide repeat protein [Gammaproteobacteria bacterium]
MCTLISCLHLFVDRLKLGAKVFSAQPKRKMLRLLCCVFLLLPGYAPAKSEEPATVSPGVYKKLQQTEKFLGDKAYGKATQLLESLLSEVKKGGYEEAAVLRSLSSVHALQEHYAKAADYLDRALKTNALPDEQRQQALLNLGQLYLASDQYVNAINILTPWLEHNSSSDAEIYALIANAYTQLKKYREALPYIERAIILSKKPSESWQQLLLALYFELENYPAAAKVLEKLIRLYPDKKDYWSHLVSLYQHTKKYREAATLKHLAYKKGLQVSEKDILDLVNLYLYIGTPYKAAALLKKEMDARRVAGGLKNWELLANAWTQAREFDRAVEALTIASNINEKGELYLQLGQIYFEQEKWRQAVHAVEKAVAKGGLKNTGTAYLILGMSRMELNDKKQARQAFVQAAKYADNRRTAEQWLEYLEQR